MKGGFDKGSGFYTKGGLISITPQIKRFAFATRFPVCKWPFVRFAIQLTNKTSE
jgi:hypothetical protein